MRSCHMSRTRATAKQAGAQWQRDICTALIERGWIHAEPRLMGGIHDRGDIAGVAGVVIEAKNTSHQKLAEAVDEAIAERDNARARLGVAWLKRKGRRHALYGYVVMDGATFMDLLEEAGYR